MSRSTLVDLAVEIVAETERAILINDHEHDEVWLPKSQVEIEREKGKFATVTMEDWLAKDKGLI